MAPPRPYWKGYLKLSLVSCPIALYAATSAGERVAFRQINKKTGNRLRQQLIDEGTGDPIEPDDKGRGYEVDKGVYLQVEDEELDAVAIESSHTIDIDSFVPNPRSTSAMLTALIIWSRRTRSRSRRSRSSATPCAARAW
jgi:DNA end-binding protein Ku